LVSLVAIVAVLPASGGTSPPKVYTVAGGEPSTVSAGDASLTLRINNLATTQSIQSANISPGAAPTGFAIIAAAFGDTTLTPSADGSCTTANPVASCLTQASTTYPAGRVVLRNIVIPAGGYLDVRLTVAVPACYTGTVTWGVVAKQSNAFNGTGNDFTFSGPQAASQFTGGCKLVYSTQPGDSGVYPSSRVSGVPTVRLVGSTCDATTLALPACAASDALNGTWVTVALKQNGSSASAKLDSGSTLSLQLIHGEAPFNNLRVTQAGTGYSLTASTSSPSLSVESVPFTVSGDLCTVTSTCSVTYQNPNDNKSLTNIRVDTSSDQNVITLKGFLQTMIPLTGCSGSKVFTPDGGGALVSTTKLRTSPTELPTLSVVTLTYNKAQRQASTDNGIGNYDLCFTGLAVGHESARFPVQTQFDPSPADGLSNTVSVDGRDQQQGVLLSCYSAAVHSPGWVNDATPASLAQNLLYPCEFSSASTSGGGAVVVGYVPDPWDYRVGGG